MKHRRGGIRGDIIGGIIGAVLGVGLLLFIGGFVWLALHDKPQPAPLVQPPDLPPESPPQFVPGVPDDHVEVFDRLAAEFPPSFQEASGLTEEQSAANETRRVTLWGSGLTLDPGPQQIGDCVSWGLAHALQCRLWVAAKGKASPDVSTLYAYGITRVAVGRGRPPCGSDGAYPSHAADGLSRYGFLFVAESGLPTYSGTEARRFGCKGPSQTQISEGRKRAGGNVQPLGDIKALRNSICSGYPCTFACPWVVAEPARTKIVAGRKCLVLESKSRGGHQVCVIGYDGTVSGKTFFYVMNSHGPRFAGGAGDGDPPGGVWVEGVDIDRLIAKGAETWSISDVPGFSPDALDLSIFDQLTAASEPRITVPVSSTQRTLDHGNWKTLAP